MNKASFQLAFLALVTSTLTGCASPTRLFAKKQSFEEFKAQRQAEQARVAGSSTARGGQVEVAELLHKGHAAFQQGNLADAQANYLAVLARQPHHPVANHRLGVIADRQQDFLTAQRYYFTALAAAPNDANLLNDIGYSYLLQSRFPEAESYLQAALQKNPKQSQAINNLGLLYAKQGQADRALAMFRLTSSEAEAQAKVARLLPASNPLAPSGTMLANQGWPPAGNSFAPATSAAVSPGVGNLGPSITTDPSIATGAVPNTIAHHGWAPPDTTSAASSSPIIPAGANVSTPLNNDAHLPESTRRLKEQMEAAKQKAVAERQARDNAERQRRELLLRQLRDEEIARNNVAQALGSQASASQPGVRTPTTAPGSQYPTGPALNGADSPTVPWSGNANVASETRAADPSAGGGLGGTYASQQGSAAVFNSAANGRPASPAYGSVYGTAGSMSDANSITHAPRETASPTAAASPLDAMPTWPPAGALPTISPRNSPSASGAAVAMPNATSGANAPRPTTAEDQAWMASRLGMSAGPGNLFPITPAPTMSAANTSRWPNSTNPNNPATSPSALSPITPPNWPADSLRSNSAPTTAEPPAGSFGPGNFGTSATTPQLPESAAQFALREQLPPSELYQTPSPFGVAPPPTRLTTSAQPASYSASRAPSGTPNAALAPQNFPMPSPQQQANEAFRAGTRSTVADRFGGDDRWEQGPAPNVAGVQTAPSVQGFLPTPTDERALQEYERMIQQHNAETNQIRQQIDRQRQLPASENYYRSRTQPQTGTPTGPAVPPQSFGQ